ncbi:hypothetical protein SS50377_23512 [Spironucleus salmonicida]|uniref:Uncharacterized protein n=1 Tax=Spironucleus salmonicida TaxID=348837 RepID=V6LNS4_9EUKA|nr:hypothetical protein SS50377_23512 [Spironucleus salmonicida]|eukprot:EST46250.1 Hypothetical protein SS50377_13846 [Spironucleus salmonicida]
MQITSKINQFKESHDPTILFDYIISLSAKQQLDCWLNPLIPAIFVSSALNRFNNTFITLYQLNKELTPKFLSLKLHIMAFSLLNASISGELRIEILTFLTLFEDLGIDSITAGLLAIQTFNIQEVQLGILLIKQSQNCIHSDMKKEILQCLTAIIQKTPQLDAESMKNLLELIQNLK